MIIVFFVQAGVSIKRLNKYMNAEEIDQDAVTHDEREGTLKKTYVNVIILYLHY